MIDAKERLTHLAQGTYVEDDTLGIIKRLQDYDEKIVVKYVDPSVAGVTDAPWRLYELCPDGIERLIFSAWKMDGSVYERLVDHDTQRVDILLRLDTTNRLAKNAQSRRFKDEREEVKDILVSALKSPKGTYSFEHKNKKITIDDDPNRTYKVEASKHAG